MFNNYPKNYSTNQYKKGHSEFYFKMTFKKD